ncbi:hypothetical protein ACIRBX_29080 [Kitasatospora sp. NPDC096147]|uniref:DUF7224 domain-containing protein n=1 Tax=Kitasatospora sp. NPDC096147 TaxID=3364093 RepID=UPI0038229DD7
MVLVAPVQVVLAVLLLRKPAVAGQVDGYWTGATAVAMWALIVVAPLGAACAAWEAGRIRQAGWAGWTPARGGLHVAARALGPVLAGGLSALVAALLTVRWEMGAAPGGPDPLILGAAVLVLIGQLAVGYAVGLLVRPVVAVPVVLVADYLWNVYPPAGDPLWLRLLPGPVRDCCDSGSVPLPGAVAAPALLALGLLAVAGAVVVHRWHPARSGPPGLPGLPRLSGPALGMVVAPLLLAAAAAGSVGLVRDLGLDPYRARSAAELVCRQEPGGPEVCVWPEHAGRLPTASAALAGASARLAAAGVPVPKVITEADPGGGADRWQVFLRVDPAFGAQQMVLSVVASPAGQARERAEADPAAPVCDRSPEGRALPERLRAWLAVTAGVDRAAAVANHGPELESWLAAQLTLPSAEQLRWYREASAAVGCRR